MSTTHLCRCGALAACKQQCDKYFDKHVDKPPPFPPRYERKKRSSYLSSWKMPNVREIGGFQSIYEKCCSFNTKYCLETQDSSKRKNIDCTIRDFCVLTCFLVANMIVFAVVLTRFICSACLTFSDGYHCARSVCRKRRRPHSGDVQTVGSNVIVVSPKSKGRQAR